MPVKAKLGDSLSEFHLHSHKNNGITLMDGLGNSLTLQTPLELKPGHKNLPFEVHLFLSKNVKENAIRQVYLNKIRIGWVIPAIAFASTDHDFANDDHFLQYAFMGIWEYLRSASHNLEDSLNPGDNTLAIQDLFHEDTVLFILSKTTFPHPDFNIDRAIPSLLPYGYIKKADRNASEIVYEGTLTPGARRIQVYEISDDILEYQHIVRLLSELFPYEKSPVFKFFYIYQVFELLLEEVDCIEYEKFATSLYASRTDLANCRELVQDFSRNRSEKNRLQSFNSRYLKPSVGTSGLEMSCNALLSRLGVEESSSLDSFYRVRNFLFHGFRKFPHHSPDMNSLLDSIVSDTVILLPKILKNFKAT